MKTENTIAMQILAKIWQNLDYSSHLRVNQGMSNIVSNLIEIGIEFEKTDIDTIFNKFRGHYWFGVSRNGKTMGEQFYRSACGSNPNNSAAQSFEQWRGRKPFIIDNKRLYEGAEFVLNGLYYTVSGFNDEAGEILCVGYTNRCNEGKRKLLKMNNHDFLIKRKEIKIY